VFLAGPFPPITNFSYPFVVALAAHGDWRGTVTESDLALRAEVVHLYATGLGPVRAPVRTGEPAAADPLPRLTQPLECSYFNTVSTLSHLPSPLYAGLAPGLIGIYQVSLAIPANLDLREAPLPGMLRVECSLPNSGFTALIPLQ
jgi:uncharacterized protein (TIGR03437 family)